MSKRIINTEQNTASPSETNSESQIPAELLELAARKKKEMQAARAAASQSKPQSLERLMGRFMELTESDIEAKERAARAKPKNKHQPEPPAQQPANGALGFIARALVLATLPHSKPKESYFSRRNGDYTFSMVAHPDTGLPYGSIPRLLLIWITSEAVRTKSRKLYLGKSLADFMRALDILPTGGRKGTITALREQLKRLFSTSISCSYTDEKRDSRLNMFIIDSSDLWWSPIENIDHDGLWESSITLSERFFEEITKSPVVFLMDALKDLRKSPMALDIYTLLTYKNSYSKSPYLISWELLQIQLGASYPDTPQGRRDFKKKFKEGFKKVCEVYPEAAKCKITKDGLFYVPGATHVPKLLPGK